MIDFETKRLGEILTTLTDYHANGSYKILKQNVELLNEPDYAVMIRTTNFEKNDFIDDLKYINEHAYNFLAKSKVFPGDILMNKIAKAGSVYYVPDLRRPVSLAMNLFLLRVDKEKTNQGYVYYYLKAKEQYVKSYAIGVAHNTITKDNVRNVEIKLPIISIQNKIVSVLSAYEKLIENNTRRIQILEEMAQRIYREWFVHFRFPGHEKVKMVGSELGMIPEGFTAGNLRDACKVIPGYAFKSKDWSEDGIAVIKIKNIRPGNFIDTCEVDHIPVDILQPNLDKYFLSNGDFLLAMTGATAGKVGRLRTKQPMILNQRVAKIDPFDGMAEFIWCRISSGEAEREFFRLADGAAQPNMSGTQIESVPLLIPTEKLLKSFASVVGPIIKLVDNLFLTNSNLKQTRDLLLPRLISGQIDVSDLEIDIGAEAA